MTDGEVTKITRTTGIVAEGVIKGFLLVAPSLFLISLTVGMAIWLTRLGTKIGGID